VHWFYSVSDQWPFRVNKINWLLINWLIDLFFSKNWKKQNGRTVRELLPCCCHLVNDSVGNTEGLLLKFTTWGTSLSKSWMDQIRSWSVYLVTSHLPRHCTSSQEQTNNLFHADMRFSTNMTASDIFLTWLITIMCPWNSFNCLLGHYKDCETIRIPPLMSKRTIRIPGEGGRRRRRGVDGTWGGT